MELGKRGVFCFTDALTPAQLTELAQQTGGQIYPLRTVGNGDQLKKDAAAIAAAIGNRYTLGFVANKPNINSFRLEVRDHPGAIIKVEGAPITIVNLADTARSK